MIASLVLASRVVQPDNGLNWQSIGVIVGATTFAFMVVTWYAARLEKRRQDDYSRREQHINEQNTLLRQEFSSAILHLGEVLSAKLETKEAVAKISERLAVAEGKIEAIGDRKDRS